MLLSAHFVIAGHILYNVKLMFFLRNKEVMFTCFKYDATRSFFIIC